MMDNFTDRFDNSIGPFEDVGANNSTKIAR